MLTLLAVELRRVLPLTLRMLGVTLGVLLLFAVAGRADAENATAILIGTTVGYLVLVPMALSRDKIDGARVAAAALVSLVGALQIAAGFAFFVVPLGIIPTGPGATAGIFALSWATLTFASCALLALIANFRLQTLLSTPLIVVGILIIALPILAERLGWNAGSMLRWVAASAPAPAVLAGILLILLTAAAVALAGITVHGVTTFRPRPDEIQL